MQALERGLGLGQESIIYASDRCSQGCWGYDPNQSLAIRYPRRIAGALSRKHRFPLCERQSLLEAEASHTTRSRIGSGIGGLPPSYVPLAMTVSVS